MRRIGARSSPYPLYPAAFNARFLVPVLKCSEGSFAPCTKTKISGILTSGFRGVLLSLLLGLRLAKTRTAVAKNSGR